MYAAKDKQLNMNVLTESCAIQPTGLKVFAFSTFTCTALGDNQVIGDENLMLVVQPFYTEFERVCTQEGEGWG